MRRIVVGISGATGAIYGIRILELLKAQAEVEPLLVITDMGKATGHDCESCATGDYCAGGMYVSPGGSALPETFARILRSLVKNRKPRGG